MLVKAEIWTVAKTDQGNAVLVRPLNGDKAVPILIGPLEAQNILLGLGEVEIPRPLTHDLMLSMLSELGAKLNRVNIHSLSEGTYYSSLLLDFKGKKLEIDARPSDALALAVRVDCPVYLESELVDEAGISLEQLKQSTLETDFEDEPEGEGLASPGTESSGQVLSRLREQLERLVATENYEEAAVLRDRIKQLEDPPTPGKSPV
jgi:hypothetical protein